MKQWSIVSTVKDVCSIISFIVHCLEVLNLFFLQLHWPKLWPIMMNSALIKTSTGNLFNNDHTAVTAAATAATIVVNNQHNNTNGATNGNNSSNNGNNSSGEVAQNGNGNNGGSALNSPVRTFSPPSPYTPSMFHRDMRRQCNSMNGNSHHVTVCMSAVNAHTVKCSLYATQVSFFELWY